MLAMAVFMAFSIAAAFGSLVIVLSNVGVMVRPADGGSVPPAATVPPCGVEGGRGAPPGAVPGCRTWVIGTGSRFAGRFIGLCATPIRTATKAARALSRTVLPRPRAVAPTAVTPTIPTRIANLFLGKPGRVNGVSIVGMHAVRGQSDSREQNAFCVTARDSVHWWLR